MVVTLLVLLTSIIVIESDDVPRQPYITVENDIKQNTTVSNYSGHYDYQASRECNQERTEIQMVFFACLMIFIPITVLGNASVCLVISCTLKLRRQPMYMFLTSLAVADIFVGSISMPLKAKIEWDGGCFRLPWFVCWIYMLEEITFSLSSALHLFAIGIDRYLALRFTFKYRRTMSRYRYLAVILSVWVFSLVWSLLSVFQWKTNFNISIKPGLMGCANINHTYFTFLYAVFYIAPVFLLVFIYTFIYKTAIRHVNEIIKVEIHDSDTQREEHRRKRQLKLLRSVVIVFMAYAICWMPCVIFILIVYHNKNVFDYREQDWFKAVRFVCINFLPHFNSTLNPFIYVISNKEFMSAMHKAFVKLTGLTLCVKVKYTKKHYASTRQADLLTLFEKEFGKCIPLKNISTEGKERRKLGFYEGRKLGFYEAHSR